jgi:hypothetical protein
MDAVLCGGSAIALTSEQVQPRWGKVDDTMDEKQVPVPGSFVGCSWGVRGVLYYLPLKSKYLENVVENSPLSTAPNTCASPL